jgi:hypothetical protein
MMQGKRKMASAAVAVSAAVGATLFGVAGPAWASNESCTKAPYGYVCNYTHGSGARVDTVDAIRAKASGEGINNPSADVSVLDANARVKWFQHKGKGGTYFGRTSLTFDVHRTFVCGYETSVAFYENGSQQGGYPNVVLC